MREVIRAHAAGKLSSEFSSLYYLQDITIASRCTFLSSTDDNTYNTT
jgi:hypothetical protein